MVAWLITLGIAAAIFFGGIEVGEMRCQNAAQAAVIEAQRDEVSRIEAQVRADVEDKLQRDAERAAMAEWMKTNANRSIDITGSLRRALGATDLSKCLLPPAVQRVRERAVQEVIDAAKPAERAGGHDQDRVSDGGLRDAGSAATDHAGRR